MSQVSQSHSADAETEVQKEWAGVRRRSTRGEMHLGREATLEGPGWGWQGAWRAHFREAAQPPSSSRRDQGAAGTDPGLSFPSPLGGLMPASDLPGPQTKLEYCPAAPSDAAESMRTKPPAQGRARREAAATITCDWNASPLGPASPHWLGGKALPCPGTWACFGGKSGPQGQRGFVLLCNLGRVT